MARRDDDSDDALRALLRGAGLRATAPRLAVLRALSGSASPASHGEVSTQLQESGWDRATVYRNLMDLTEVNLVRRTDLGDHTWRFELSRDGHEDEVAHPHFLCDACGDVVCLPDGSVKVVAAKGAPLALVKREFEVQVKGRCDRCA